MVEELTALHLSHTWDLVYLPPIKHMIGCRWVYKIKKFVRFVEQYKVVLVAKGYSQQYCFDYEKTFSPKAKMATIIL